MISVIIGPNLVTSTNVYAAGALRVQACGKTPANNILDPPRIAVGSASGSQSGTIDITNATGVITVTSSGGKVMTTVRNASASGTLSISFNGKSNSKTIQSALSDGAKTLSSQSWAAKIDLGSEVVSGTLNWTISASATCSDSSVNSSSAGNCQYGVVDMNVPTASYSKGTPTPKYTLTIDANGGSYSGSTSITKEKGDTYMLSSPYRSSYRFDGWTTSGSTWSGNTFTFNSDGTAKANWTYVPPTPQYTLTVDLNGGTYNGSSSYTRNEGSTIDLSNYSTPTRSTDYYADREVSYRFNRWSWSNSNGSGDTYSFYSNGTATANWYTTTTWKPPVFNGSLPIQNVKK